MMQNKKPTVVVDTNLFISGIIILHGNPFELLEAWRVREFTLLTSQAICKEVASVLRRPKIKEKYRLSDNTIESLIVSLEEASIEVFTTTELAVKLRDPKDTMVLACAMVYGKKSRLFRDWG